MFAPRSIMLKMGLQWLIKNYKMSVNSEAVNYPLQLKGFKVNDYAQEIVWEVSVAPKSGAPHFKAACSIAYHIPAEDNEDIFVVSFHEKDDYRKLFALSDLVHDSGILEKMSGVDGCRIGFLAGVRSMMKEAKEDLMNKV